MIRLKVFWERRVWRSYILGWAKVLLRKAFYIYAALELPACSVSTLYRKFHYISWAFIIHNPYFISILLWATFCWPNRPAQVLILSAPFTRNRQAYLPFLKISPIYDFIFAVWKPKFIAANHIISPRNGCSHNQYKIAVKFKFPVRLVFEFRHQLFFSELH